MIVSAPQRHLYLIGFMGTGKSTVGRVAAQRLERPFVDLDTMVEQLAHRPIAEIFAQGEDGFRILETRALRLVAASPAKVIALGGGAPMVPVIADLARQTGRIVWLTADWRTIRERVRLDGNTRPLLAPLSAELCDPDPSRVWPRFREHVEPLWQMRVGAYERLADLTIDTSKLDVDAVVCRIMAWNASPT
jgi:shikimate kinase